MKSEWAIVKFQEILEITSSKRIFRAEYVDSGVPFYRSKEIIEKSKGNNISTELFISQDKFNDLKDKFGVPIPGDILLTSVGTLGVPYLVQFGDNFYFKDGNLTWFRHFSDKINNHFILCWLQSNEAKKQFDMITIGSTQKALTISSLKEIEIQLPPINIQQKITHLISTLDSKIELNQKMNKTLEEMAQTLFKSWFVDFDPVHAKMKAKESDTDLEQIAKELGISKDVLDLFPDEFEESELGMIPKGWEVVEFVDISSELRRGISPKYTEDEDVTVINQRCIRNGEVNLSLSRQHDSSKKNIDNRLIKAGDILVNSTGVGTLGRVAQIAEITKRVIVDSHVTMVRADLDKVSSNFLGVALISKQKTIEKLGEGSTGQTELSRVRLGELKVVLPLKKFINVYDELTVSMRSNSQNNRNEIESLQKTRDTLLPKLLSGELDVSELNL